MMDLEKFKLDLTLVPLSICLTAGYHAYIWQSYNAKQPVTAIGVTMKRRITWLQDIVQHNGKKGTLGVQSFRNSLMYMILSASIAIIMNSSLAAIANNTYKSNHLLLQHPIFGSQSDSLLVVKYCTVSILLLFSFLCSSMAVWFIIEASFSLNAPPDYAQEHAHMLMKRGFLLGIVGNRVLFMTLPFLFWMLGPVALALSSLALVLLFYSLDFSVASTEDQVPQDIWFKE
ncbi:hypothetical protein J5N97_014670 [Dioscorea zingiberensis]|uniref:DUF599 domain-containing protein n=1 Tax=Dioscorea zingiberensis TaxID=325984 RepID=A0A9D5CT65_9LILI|nr:hypothetical protein J5N97_014670 [Dioscorea zingiberensis]